MNMDNRRQAITNHCVRCRHLYSEHITHTRHLYSEDAVHNHNTLVIMDCMKCECLVVNSQGEGR